MLLLVLQVIDLLLYVIVIVLRLFILRLELHGLLVMIERISPIAQLFVVILLYFAALVERVAQVVMALALQAIIGRKQSLTKRLKRLAVFFRFVSGRAGIKLQ